MIKVAIVGAGAVGASVGAWLTTRDDIDVTFCVRTRFDRLCVETPNGTISVVPKLISDPDAAEAVDWVVVATKAYDAPAAADWIRALSSSTTRVAILQNGVEHSTRFPMVEHDRLVPAIVDIPAERKAPGHVVQRRTGSMIVPAGKSGHDFADLFRGTPIDVRLTDDWKTAAWQKLEVGGSIVPGPEVRSCRTGRMRGLEGSTSRQPEPILRGSAPTARARRPIASETDIRPRIAGTGRDQRDGSATTIVVPEDRPSVSTDSPRRPAGRSIAADWARASPG